MSMKDPLGRDCSSTIEAKRRRLLTAGEMDAIANEVRTKPITEVGRHVMPLVHHASEQQDIVIDLLAAIEAMHCPACSVCFGERQPLRDYGNWCKVCEALRFQIIKAKAVSS